MKRPKIIRLKRAKPKIWKPPPYYGKSIIDQMIPLISQIGEAQMRINIMLSNTPRRCLPLLPEEYLKEKYPESFGNVKQKE